MVMQVHGIMATDTVNIRQRIQLTDCAEHVTFIHTGQNFIILDADDLRYLAKEFVAAAKRLDERLKK